jgi:predicted RNA-binding Zn ribbon-like protein
VTPSDSDLVPPRLDLLGRFVNTLDYPSGPDLLENAASASQWCGEHGLSPISSAREADRLRAFREALRGALYANNGEGDPVQAWQQMRPYLSTARYGLAFESERGLSLNPGAAGADRSIAALLAIAYEAMIAGTWGRLRACRKGSCRFAYYDSSKNGSRAWCSMSVCGNREKAARRRTRERHE